MKKRLAARIKKMLKDLDRKVSEKLKKKKRDDDFGGAGVPVKPTKPLPVLVGAGAKKLGED